MSKVQSYCVEHRIIKSSPRLSNHNIWHILSFTVTVKLFTNNCGAVTWIQHCCCYRGASFFISDSLPLFPHSSRHSTSPIPLPHPRVLSLIWMGMCRATSNTCSMPPCPLPQPPPPPLSSLAINLFSFVQPILRCAVWFTKAWKTCDHSAGYQELQAASVFRGEGRERTRKTIWHKQPTTRTFCMIWEHVESARGHSLCLTGMNVKWNVWVLYVTLLNIIHCTNPKHFF